MGFGERTAEDRKVLCEDEDAATVDKPVPRDDAIARKLLRLQAEILRAMNDEFIELLECSFIKKEVDTLVRRHLSGSVLTLDAFATAAVFGICGASAKVI
jgi:hypothetical protein